MQACFPPSHFLLLDSLQHASSPIHFLAADFCSARPGNRSVSINVKWKSVLKPKQLGMTMAPSVLGTSLPTGCRKLPSSGKSAARPTVHRVSGSYEGEGLLDRRARRILAQQMEQEVRHP